MVAIGCVAICLPLTAVQADEKTDETPAKTREVKVKDITLTVPESWEQQEPSNKLRLAQFAIPPAEGDENGVELTVFSFGASSVQANVNRWVGQFQQKGRKVKISQGKSSQGRYVIVELSGTYNQPIGPPIAGRTKPMPDARMLAVILVVEDKGVYYLKMAGPEKTVSAAGEAFRASFGGSVKQEKELKPDEPDEE